MVHVIVTAWFRSAHRSVMCVPGEILLEKRYDGLSAADAHLARISDHVSAYLQIVRSQLLATVPKAVVHCTVVPAKDNLLAELQEEVAGGTLLGCGFEAQMPTDQQWFV
jgi:hypothetical protein